MEHEEFLEFVEGEGFTPQDWHATDEAKGFYTSHLADKGFKYDAESGKIVSISEDTSSEEAPSKRTNLLKQSIEQTRPKARGGKVKKKKKSKKGYSKKYANGGTIRKPRRAK